MSALDTSVCDCLHWEGVRWSERDGRDLERCLLLVEGGKNLPYGSIDSCLGTADNPVENSTLVGTVGLSL